jgi:hypothetical protein
MFVAIMLVEKEEKLMQVCVLLLLAKTVISWEKKMTFFLEKRLMAKLILLFVRGNAVEREVD